MGNAWLARRLWLRLYLAWFLARRTPRHTVLNTLGVAGWVIEAAAAWLLLILVPAQLAFAIHVEFNWAYAIGYSLDAILLAKRFYRLCTLFRAAGHRALAFLDARLEGKLGVVESLQKRSRASGGQPSPPQSPSRRGISFDTLLASSGRLRVAGGGTRLATSIPTLAASRPTHPPHPFLVLVRIRD